MNTSARTAAGIVFGVGTIVLLGWTFHLVALESVVPRFPPMVPNTALGFIAAAISLWLLLAKRRVRWKAWAGRAAALLVLSFGCLTLIEYLMGWRLPVDQLLFQDGIRSVRAPFPGRPSFLTALNFLFLGFALLLRDMKRVRVWVLDLLILIPVQISMLALIGYACSVPAFYGWFSIAPNTAMALHTTLAFIVLGVGLLCARPERGLMKVLLGNTAGGIVARRLLLAPVIIPLATGLIRIAGHRAEFYNPEIAGWLFSFANIFIFTAVIWWIAVLLHRTDATRRLAEERVRERTGELESANEELEAFSYSISHDLRAPLRAVSGFSSIVLQQFSPQLPADAQRLLKEINGSAREMGRLIDGLLEFSRLGRHTLARQPLNLSAMAHEVIAELRQGQPNRKIEIRVQDLPECIGDPLLFKQVFVNLLSNAFKFTRHTENAVVEVGHCQRESESVYFVRDNGAGFDMQYAGKLFGVFQRLHRNDEFEGTGVGLSIVQRIIHRHGGRIWAESEVNKGAVFNFTIASRE